MRSPRAQLNQFLARFTPEIEAHAQAVLGKLRRRLPGSLELVYDNYNALAIGFSPTEKTSQVIFSIAVFPRWVSLFFFRGVTLPDPSKILQGSGSLVRHLVIDELALLDRPAVKKLIAVAVARAKPTFDPKQPRRIVIKSVSPNQRPRRPVAQPTKRGKRGARA